MSTAPSLAGRAPVLFLAHGAPTLALDAGAFGEDLAAFAAALPRPRAIAIVSAHWTTGGEIGVTGAAHHRLIYDFSGFPEALYRIRWPAPGAPEVAARVVALLESAGFRSRLDLVRGLDHGAWVPLRVGWPQADVPVVQLALPEVAPPTLYRLGAALAPLRDDGVLLVASGGIVHNLARVRFDARGPADPWAVAFDAWVAERLAARDLDALARWHEDGPQAALAAPSPEHLDPLFVALGAASADDRLQTIHQGFTHGNLGMRSVALVPRGLSAALTEARKEPHP